MFDSETRSIRVFSFLRSIAMPRMVDAGCAGRGLAGTPTLRKRRLPRPRSRSKARDFTPFVAGYRHLSADRLTVFIGRLAQPAAGVVDGAELALGHRPGVEDGDRERQAAGELPSWRASRGRSAPARATGSCRRAFAHEAAHRVRLHRRPAPARSSPCGRCSRAKRSSSGISVTQGGHQVAQKLSSSGLPRRLLIASVAPSGVSKLERPEVDRPRRRSASPRRARQSAKPAPAAAAATAGGAEDERGAGSRRRPQRVAARPGRRAAAAPRASRRRAPRRSS